MKNKRPAVMAAILIVLCTASLLFLILPTGKSGEYIADIYQNGELAMSIPLAKEPKTRIILIEGENGCRNEIEIRPGSIGVISADCPDKICVRQGFISDSRLPITCLPNRLVIQLRPAAGESAPQADINTY